jgi:hypothetical protein
VISLLITSVLIVGIPFCHKALLVSRAHTKEDIENLAKYLACKSCKKNNPSKDVWRTFLPAAKILGAEHSQKRYDRVSTRNSHLQY